MLTEEVQIEFLWTATPYISRNLKTTCEYLPHNNPISYTIRVERSQCVTITRLAVKLHFNVLDASVFHTPIATIGLFISHTHHVVRGPR
jgi:hypothetical protein